MSDQLKVNPAALRTLSGDLGSIRDQLDDTGRLLSRYRDDVGSHRVQDALGSFEDHWGDGRRKIREKAEALQTMASDSADEFESTDVDAASSIEKNDSEHTVTGVR